MTDSTTCNSTIAWLYPLICKVISLAVMPCMKVGLTTENQRNPYTHFIGLQLHSLVTYVNT